MGHAPPGRKRAIVKRLHIVGCPRSGTTLLMELLATCFEHDGASAHESSIFEQCSGNHGLYISKQPNDIRQLQHVFYRDESLYIIYMSRDPRAVITSEHAASPGQYFCNYRVWRECDSTAQAYQDHPRFLQLRYEDLVSNPNQVQANITMYYPLLKQRHPFSQYQHFAQASRAAQQAMHGVRPINTASLEKWRAHLPRLVEQYQRYPELPDALVRLGYEPDTSWLNTLQNVQGITYPCRYPEQRETLKELEKRLRVYLKSRRYLQQMHGRSD